MAIIADIVDFVDDRFNNANGQPVQIRELDGLQTTLYLGTKARPQRGVEVRDKVRFSKQFYPGNDEATIHIQGMEYDDIVLRGRFHDPVGDVFIGGSRRRVELLRGLQHRRSTCELSWGGNIVRTGIVADVTITEKTHHDVNYEIRFVVAKAGEVGTEATNTEQLNATQRALDRLIRTTRNVLNTVLDVTSAASVLGNAVNLNLTVPFYRRPSQR